MSDIVERLEATKHGLYWDVARDATAEITRLLTLLSVAEQREKDTRAKALEEAAKGCDAVADRPLQGPEHGVWERAERQTAKRLAQSIRALQSEER